MRQKAHNDQRNGESIDALAEVGLASAGIIHEMKNALQGVATALFLLDAQRGLRPKPREWIATARRELARAFEISHQTMTLVRGENAGPVRVTDVLEDVLNTYSGKIAYKGITIERRYEFKEIIKADAGAVRQVFANIVLNALEAAPRGTGKLVIRTSASHLVNRKGVAGVRILFADNGSGISDKDKKKVFEPLFSTKKGKGTGLGLWVTAELIRKQRGGLRLRSRSKGFASGTCFSVFFPLNQNSSGPASAASWPLAAVRMAHPQRES
jgi:two-component system, sporulation sensor kinase E